MTQRTPAPLGLALLLGTLVGSAFSPSLAAETYSVKLVSGATLDLLYPLEESPWDKDTLVYLSEGGNWVAIPRAEVREVIIATEFKGQGQVIDDSTIFMGLAANDLPLPGDPNEANNTDRLLQVLQQIGKTPVVNTEQFVDPGSAGGGGIPLNLTQPYSPQSGSQQVIPQVVPLGAGFGSNDGGISQ